MYDAVGLFGAALIKLDDELPNGLNIKSLQCQSGNTWEDGRNLVWFMKMVIISLELKTKKIIENIINVSCVLVNDHVQLTIEGVTGPVRIDAQGFRREFGLDILEAGKRGLERVGRWEMSTGANYTRLWRDREAEYRQELKDKNMIVTVPSVS